MQTEKFVVPTAEFVIFLKQDIVTTSGDVETQPNNKEAEGGGIVTPDNNFNS